MPQLAAYRWITAGVAVAGAGVIAVTPVTAPLPDVQVADIALTATDITLDFVRHGQSQDNVDGILGTEPPGAHLTDVGEQQAQDVALEINGAFPNGIDAIYASELLRTQETAAPLADLLGMNVHELSGLNELNAGVLEGMDLNTFTEIGYVFAPLMWIMGLEYVPQLGSTVDPNGMAFEDRVSDAVEAIYDNSVDDPDSTGVDVAFAHAGTIAVWTLMNVKNPDFSVVLDQLGDTHDPLANTGQVVLDGNPTDGWTLVSWNGEDVAQDPDPGTALFVDFRDLITAPQMAAWHIWEAFEGGDSDAITAAIQNGFDEVGAAITQFFESVSSDLADAFASI